VRIVRPDAVSTVWLCKPKRQVKGVQRERDFTGMPTELPELPDDQYSLPELVGAMFDSTVLAGDAIRVVADTWCRHALDGLHRAGRVVRPLRDAAKNARAAAREAAALEVGDADEWLTTSFVSSTDSDAGSGSTADSDRAVANPSPGADGCQWPAAGRASAAPPPWPPLCAACNCQWRWFLTYSAWVSGSRRKLAMSGRAYAAAMVTG
jgi:hypothetical protein